MYLRIVTTISAFLILSACASSPQEPVNIEEEMAERNFLIGPDDQRIPRYGISSWQHVDDRHLVVRSGVRDYYLVELFGPCFNLDSAFFVGFTTPTSRVDRFADLVVEGPGGRRERCSISNIYLLADVEADANQTDPE